MKTENVWIMSNIVLFYSDQCQQRADAIVKDLNNLVVSLENGTKSESTIENNYNYLFENIFPKPDVVSKMWQHMDIKQKMTFLTRAAIIYDLYAQAWGKEPRFIPGFIKQLIRMIV